MTMENKTRRDFLATSARGAVGAALTAASYNKVLGANDRVRLGIIGPGARGQETMKYFLEAPNTEFVAAADVYTRRLDEVKKFGANIQGYGDHRKMLESKDVDAVIISSPLHIHSRHFLDTLAAGKDMYAEKTMTWSIEEAEACLAAAKKNPKRVIGVGQQHNSAGYFQDARKWVKDGLVGKVAQVESWMSRNTPHGKGQWVRPIPADCNAQNVNWKAFLNGRQDRPFDANKFINWRLFWEFSGGNVTENMVHQIAWIMSALDLPLPSAAYMSGGVFSEKDGREVPDTIAVTLDFPNDMVVTWQSTFNNSRYGLGERLLGSDGTIEHVAGANDMVSGKSGESTHYFPEKTNRRDGVALTGNSSDQDHMSNWIECMRTRKTPNAPVDIGYRSAVAAHMANLAYRRKQRITLETAQSAQVQV